MSSIEKLEVTVVSAALKEDPSGMLIDSANYVHLRFGATKMKTKTVYGMKQLPQWDEVFELDLKQREKMLYVTVYNENTLSDDSIIGECSIFYDELKTN